MLHEEFIKKSNHVNSFCRNRITIVKSRHITNIIQQSHLKEMKRNTIMRRKSMEKSLTSSTGDVFKTNTKSAGSLYIFRNAVKILSIPSPL